MKHALSIICAMLLCMTACDVIPIDNRITTITDNTARKSVLLLDMTGWRCVNCPDAARIAHELQEQYGDKFVVVSAHPDCHWTTPSGAALDLRCEVATAYWKYFGQPAAFPTGIIDNVQFAGSYLTDRDAWAANVMQRTAITPEFELTLNSTLSSNTASIKATVTNISTTANRQLNVILLVTEDSIVGAQMVEGHPQPDYVHNHVLRTAVTDLWGTSIATPGTGESVTLTQTTQIDTPWLVKHCNIVAVLIDAATEEVLAARQTPVMGAASSDFNITMLTEDNTKRTLHNGDTIIVTQFDSIAGSLAFNGYIENTSEEQLDIIVSATRAYDISTATDEFCINMCVPSNGQATQDFTGNIAPEYSQTFFAHLTPTIPGNYTITYTFHTNNSVQGSTMITVVFSHEP